MTGPSVAARKASMPPLIVWVMACPPRANGRKTSLSCEPTNVLKFAEVARWNDRDCCGVGAVHVGDAGPGGAVTTIERRPNIVGLLVALVVLVAGGLVWV